MERHRYPASWQGEVSPIRSVFGHKDNQSSPGCSNAKVELLVFLLGRTCLQALKQRHHAPRWPLVSTKTTTSIRETSEDQKIWLVSKYGSVALSWSFGESSIWKSHCGMTPTRVAWIGVNWIFDTKLCSIWTLKEIICPSTQIPLSWTTRLQIYLSTASSHGHFYLLLICRSVKLYSDGKEHRIHTWISFSVRWAFVAPKWCFYEAEDEALGNPCKLWATRTEVLFGASCIFTARGSARRNYLDSSCDGEPDIPMDRWRRNSFWCLA